MIGVGHFLLGRFTACALWAVLVFWSGVGLAAEPATNGEGVLLARHSAIKAKLEKNQFGAPIYLESTESQGKVRVDMYGVFNYPFDMVRDALQSPANWCDIAPQHINIKACVYKRGGESSQLTLYSGRKHYQPPSDAYPLKLRFRVVSQQPRYLHLSLDADEGPLRTKDHRITLQAAPLDSQRTFLYFSYTYSHGPVARMAIKSYFSTLGRGKVGFSVVGGKGGKQYYIEGVRGAIERNTVRYYLALQTYMDALKYPESQRFEQRLSRWFDLTSKYQRQLKEMEMGDYLASKRLEHKNQLALQKTEGS